MNHVPEFGEDEVERFLTAPDSAAVLELRGGRWTGKTTVLARLADAATDLGWTVASGRIPVQPAVSMPFGLFLGVMDDLGWAGGSGGGSTDARSRVKKARFIDPLAKQRHGGLRLVPDSSVITYEDFQAIHALLESKSMAGGLLIVLDDVQWADAASLELLKHLVFHLPPGAVRLALAHRPRQISLGLHAVLDEAARNGTAERVSPPRLSEHEACALLPDDISRTQRSLMLELSGRNPGLLNTLASLPSPLGGDHTSAANLPVAVLAAVLRDFQGLSPSGWTVARSAAVLAEPFSLAMLQSVAQTTDEELQDAIDELVRHDILSTDGDVRKLRFSSWLLRSAAYQSMGPGWLLGAHARAATTLSERGGDSVQLAAHLHYRVTVDSRTSQVLLQAAAAHRWTDATQALAWAEKALAGGRPEEDGRRTAVVVGSALALSGQFGRSVQTLTGTAGETPLTEHGVEAVVWKAWATQMLGGAEAAESEMSAHVKELVHVPDELRALVLAGWLASALYAGRTVPRASLDELLALADQLPVAAQGWVFALGATTGATGDGPSQARAHAHAVTAARLLDGLDDDGVCRHLAGLFWLARAETALQRPALAVGHLERGLHLTECRRFYGWLPLFAGALAEAEASTGDLAGAVRHATVAVSGARRTDSPYLRTRLEALRADVTARLANRSAADVGDLAARRVVERDDEPADGLRETLTKRELEVAVLVSEGRTNRQIARTLLVSQKTVETHLGRIFRKLVVSSRAQLAALVGREFVHTHAGRLGRAVG